MIILCSTGALTHLATPQESRESMRSKAGIDADASMGEEGESKAAGGRGDVRMDGVPAFDDSWLAVPAKQVEPPPAPTINSRAHSNTATRRPEGEGEGRKDSNASVELPLGVGGRRGGAFHLIRYRGSSYHL